MINILVVDDSPLMRELLVYTLSSDSQFNVVGLAANGQEAVDLVLEKKPDVVAMDFKMPILDGYAATRKIMEIHPTPIVIVTGSVVSTDYAYKFSLVEAGALAIIKKPRSLDHPKYREDADKMIQTLKMMSEVKVVRRIKQTKVKPASKLPIPRSVLKGKKFSLVVIGASTGGPRVLQEILGSLTKFSLPILIVQHIAQGFSQGLAEWLETTTNFPVRVASHGQKALPGHAYIAMEGYHIGMGKGLEIKLSAHELENGARPSVSYLFRTVANEYGSEAIGILLTGMGRDGAKELKLLKDKGALAIAQNEESSVVFGMPGEAIKLDSKIKLSTPKEIILALKEVNLRNIDI